MEIPCTVEEVKKDLRTGRKQGGRERGQETRNCRSREKQKRGRLSLYVFRLKVAQEPLDDREDTFRAKCMYLFYKRLCCSLLRADIYIHANGLFTAWRRRNEQEQGKKTPEGQTARVRRLLLPPSTEKYRTAVLLLLRVTTTGRELGRPLVRGKHVLCKTTLFWLVILQVWRMS